MVKLAPYHDFQPLALEPTTRVFVLTGAGISAESGIRTFRDANGLWEQYRVEDVASPEGWAANPALKTCWASDCFSAHRTSTRFTNARGHGAPSTCTAS